LTSELVTGRLASIITNIITTLIAITSADYREERGVVWLGYPSMAVYFAYIESKKPIHNDGLLLIIQKSISD